MNTVELEDMESQAWESLDEGPEKDSPSEEETQATKEGAEPGSPTEPEEDSLPDDGTGSSDNGEGDDDGETATLNDDGTDDEDTDDQENEDGGDENDQEELTATRRVQQAQQKMHQATSEAAQYRKDLEETQAKLAELQKAIDDGTAIPSRELRLQALKARLTPEQQDFLDMNPELADLQLALMEANQPSKEKIVEQQEGQLSPAEAKWFDYVSENIPEFLQIKQSPEYQKFVENNQSYVDLIGARYDNLDPQGAEKLYKSYLSWKQKSSSRSKPTTTDRPAGRSVTSPKGGTNGRPKSLASLEEEAWKDL